MSSEIRLLLLSLLFLAAANAAAQESKGIFARPPGGIEVIEALYGQGEQLCDATQSVARICRGQGACEFRADNGLCGDPARSERKALAVVYECRRGERAFHLVQEGQQVLLECAGFDGGHGAGPPPGWQQDRIYVSQVLYGAGERVCDATGAFARACDGRSACEVPVSNRLCGDPASGRLKSAEVRFWCNGRIEGGSIREGEVAYLTCP